MDNSPLEVLNLTSISGITMMTMFIIEILKKQLADVAWFKKIPVFAYAAVISGILAILANQVIKTDDGSPMLSGNVWKVLWAAVISALGSSGLYTWLRKPEPLESAKKADKGDVIVTPKLLAVLFGVLAVVGGCQCPEKAILREGMDQSTRTIRKDHKEWAEKLKVDPATGQDRRSELPKLSENDLRAVQNAHQQYEDLVNKDRANDK